MKEIREIVLNAKDPEAPRVPGDKQCKFCPAAATCPERRASVQSVMEGAFEVLDDSPAPIASVDAITDIVDVKMREDPAAMSPDQIGRILDMEPLVTGWFADVRKRAMKMVEAGQDVPGWKLIAGKRSREWTKSEEELLAEFKSMGLSKQASYTHKLLTPNQAEQVEAIAGSKKRRERLSELWRWKEGKPTLAPDSDPAPALRDAENVFEDLGEPPAAPSEEPSWM
jgi:hypothetical protein